MGIQRTPLHYKKARTQHVSINSSIYQQDTIPLPTITPALSHGHLIQHIQPVSPPTLPPISHTGVLSLTPHIKKSPLRRWLAFVLLGLLVLTLYVIWNNGAQSTSAPSITQQNFNNTTGNNSSLNTLPTTASFINSNSSTGGITVYVTGAVKNPGVYTLPADARVYQLLQMAGGALPGADLVALNLASKLSDGQEVYVPLVGEAMPGNVGGITGTSNSAGSSSGTLLNINTASASDMRLALHVSSTTAQNIVNYRLQHGAYTSVDQLLNVVSKSIYTKIKDLVTVS